MAAQREAEWILKEEKKAALKAEKEELRKQRALDLDHKKLQSQLNESAVSLK